MTSYLVPVYATYFVAVVGLCAGLARTLFRNGAVFLQEVFEDRPDLAESVNRLLVTGFAMLNLGYGFFLLQGGEATDGRTAFEVLARKLGILLVSLAVVHFVNLAVFHRIATRRRQVELHPPVAPQWWVDGRDERPPPPAPGRGQADVPGQHGRPALAGAWTAGYGPGTAGPAPA